MSAAVAGTNLGGQHQIALKVHHMLGLVGQVRAAVFHLRDPALRIGFETHSSLLTFLFFRCLS